MENSKIALIIAVVLLVITLLVSANILINENKTFKVGDLEIKSYNLKQILDSHLEGNIIICSVKDNKCGSINKINIEK